MDSYNVGSNTPIKLKVSAATEAIAFTYVSLNDPSQQGRFKPDISFVVTSGSGWKQINKGNESSGRTLRVRTILDFHNEFSNETTFNLAVDQAKNSYSVLLTGGNPSKHEMSFDVYPNYERNAVFFSADISLI